MCNTADKALDRLNTIAVEFQSFVAGKGRTSEADTRVKLIDRILKEVCLWPEDALSREDRVENGYTDYQLKIREQPYVVVEAKREGISFLLPEHSSHRSPALNGALVTDTNVREVIQQVRKYCDEEGVKFAIATNGYAWIVFRAIRDDMPWRNGRARVFPSIEYIKQNFVFFWNLLSFPSICRGSLDSEFGRHPFASRGLKRVIDRLYNADLPLHRNRITPQLQPLITFIFEDIAAQEDVDLLAQCYVHSRSLRVVADDINLVITDTIPKNVAFAGTKPLLQGANDTGDFGDEIQKAVDSRQGELYLLLGGIGSGKTTFLKRYEKIIAKDLLEGSSFKFHIDFLKAPLAVDKLEFFVWSAILDSLRTKYEDLDVEQRKVVKTVFKDKIKNLENTALRGKRKHTEEFEQALGKFILEWQQDLSDYVPKLLRATSTIKSRAVVIFIDNVDQLDPEYQAKIFLLAQRITRLAASVTIIALREESYYTASIQNSFTAYTSHKFHIASPRFSKMIISRISYAIRALEPEDGSKREAFLERQDFDPNDIRDFLGIVRGSVFEWDKRIGRFMECICFGNMRSALQMFTTFLTSGATDVDKMLSIYRRDGGYHVAFHEFLKSVMLQDRAYYKEEQSPILNLFNCTGERNSSHFTGLRIIELLLNRRGESSPEGQGYVELGRLIGFFADSLDNEQDLLVTLDRLIRRQIVEVNTRSQSTASGASHVRVTAAGWYYLRYLARTFAYLDLVIQDTPLNDEELEKYLRQSVYEVNNLKDRELEKERRMGVRFDRTQRFIDYLKSEEDLEFDRFNMDRLPSPLNSKFIPNIQARFSSDRAYIERKLREGRLVDTPDEPEEADENLVEQFELPLPEDQT